MTPASRASDDTAGLPAESTTRAKPPSASNPHRHLVFLGGLLIAVAVLLAYANSLRGPFVYDDVPAIPENPTLQSPLRLQRVLIPPPNTTVSGRPVLNLSLAVNHAMSGNAVWSYHVTNVLIHLLAALVLFGLVRRTLTAGVTAGAAGVAGGADPGSDVAGVGDPGPGIPAGGDRARSNARAPGSPPPATADRPHRGRLQRDALRVAFVVALFWALHPLVTEAVDYIVQRAESLMSLFLLLTLYCFVRAVDSSAARRPSSGPGVPSSILWLAASVVCCAFGMATKENMAATPILVLLYDRAFVSGEFIAALRRHPRYYGALAATWVLLAILILSTGGNRSGTVGFGVGISMLAYWLTQPSALVHYLALSGWPAPLVFDYGTLWVHHLATVLLPTCVVLGLVALTFWAMRKNRPSGFLGAVCFGLLAPTSLVPGVSQMVVEHRMYLPLAALLVLVVIAVRRVVGHRGLLIAAVAAPSLLALTASRNRAYRTDALLWTDTAAKCPDNPRAYFNLANGLQDRGRLNDALALYQKAIALFPEYVEARNNLGNTFCQLGRYSDALPEYQAALRLAPHSAGAHNNVANVLCALGRPADAIPEYREALRLDPNFRDACLNLGTALMQLSRPAEAVPEFERALALDPVHGNVHASLADALVHAGRVRDALPQFEAALRQDPKNAELRAMYGNALADSNHVDEALAQFAQAASEQPSSVIVQYNYGATLLSAGRTAEAIARFEHVLRLQPDFAPARNALEQIRAAQK